MHAISFYVVLIITCILIDFYINYLKLLGIKTGIMLQFQEKGHDKREFYSNQALTTSVTQSALNLSYQLNYIRVHSTSYTDLFSKTPFTTISANRVLH